MGEAGLVELALDGGGGEVAGFVGAAQQAEARLAVIDDYVIRDVMRRKP